MSEKCSAECCDRSARFPRWYPCDKSAKVVRDGKSYCGIHDPVKIKAKQDERRAASVAKWNRRWKSLERQSECVKACEGMVNPVAEVAALKAAVKKYEMEASTRA